MPIKIYCFIFANCVLFGFLYINMVYKMTTLLQMEMYYVRDYTTGSTSVSPFWITWIHPRPLVEFVLINL